MVEIVCFFTIGSVSWDSLPPGFLYKSCPFFVNELPLLLIRCEQTYREKEISVQNYLFNTKHGERIEKQQKKFLQKYTCFSLQEIHLP